MKHWIRHAWPAIAVASALAIVACWVFHGALGVFFAQEDFRGLAVAQGLLPRHAVLWRYVSVQTFMDVFYPPFGVRPFPYHWLGLALHVANALGLYLLLAQCLSRLSALIAASYFATHPSLFTALYWLSARSDILAATFALLTVGFALRRDWTRWLSVPAFALALLSKESVIFLPLAVSLIRSWARTANRGQPPSKHMAPDLLILVLVALSMAFGLYLASGRGGLTIGRSPSDAYVLNFGGTVARNLLTYLGWASDLVMLPSPFRFVDVQNPHMFWIAWLVIAAWTAGCLVSGLRSRGWHVAGASFFLLLLPVLPLRNHTYRYFSYVALMAAAWCVGALVDLARQRLVSKLAPARTEGIAWICAGVCVCLLAWNGHRLVRRMETRPMRVYPALRADPIVNRAQIAENVIQGLAAVGLPEGTNLAFVLRERIALLARIGLGSREAPPPSAPDYFETNVRTALFDGYGVRALIPAVKSVTFSPDPLRVTDRLRFVVYSPAGEVEVYTRPQLDSLLATPWITRW
jgi:hypothetical protein